MILIVDDNPEIRDLYQRALEGAGYRVGVARSGAEALARIAGGGIRLVLMDLSLPDGNGADVATEARAIGCTVPMVAVSGVLPLIDPARLVAAGFAETVAKPIRLSSLPELARRYIEP